MDGHEKEDASLRNMGVERTRFLDVAMKVMVSRGVSC